MIKEEQVYQIGLFNKPHGIHGELQFTFTDDVFDRVEAEYIICRMDGILVPFFIEEYRFRSDTTALMKLEDVDSAEQARKFTNIPVFFPKDLAVEDEDAELTWDFFKGFAVVDVNHGPLGVVTEVDNSTINTLFIIEKKDDEEELYLPAHEEIIKDIDYKKQIITIEAPQGLIEMSQAIDENDGDEEED